MAQEAVTWSEFHYKPTARLPRLAVKDISRRDSITSSKTGDSGYNSDPEISASPVDFNYSDARLATPPFERPRLRATPASATLSCSVIDIDGRVASAWGGCRPRKTHGSILLKKAGDCVLPTKFARPPVTSNPTAAGPPPTFDRLNWPNAFKDPSKLRAVETSSSTCCKGHPASDCKEEVELWIDDTIPSHDRPKERVSSIVSLSSADSGGDYTLTDDSENEETDQTACSMLSKATLKTINIIMRKIEVNLRYAAYVQCAGKQSGRAGGSGGLAGGRRGSTQGNAGKRKARGEDGLSPNDQEDNNPNKRRRTSVTTTEDSESGPRFACPFYKHDPLRYKSRRTCPGPGWPTVHRMKEHLYRSHAQPIYCPRCYSMFDADGDLSNHLRSDPCSMSAPQPIEGIDRETLKSLRKRSAPLRLEEDKWRDTYQLLFPQVADADIPSPYHENDSPTEESRRFRRVLLQRIQHELFTTAERETGAAEQNLLRQVASIIRRCENDLLNELQSESSPRLPVSPPPRLKPSPGTTNLSTAPRGQLSQTEPNSPPSAAQNEYQSGAGSSSHFYGSQPLTGGMGTSSDNTGARFQNGLAAMHPFTPVVPNHISPGWQGPFNESPSDWVDWNAVFPSVPDMPNNDNDNSVQPPPLTMPVWT